MPVLEGSKGWVVSVSDATYCGLFMGKFPPAMSAATSPGWDASLLQVITGTLSGCFYS